MPEQRVGGAHHVNGAWAFAFRNRVIFFSEGNACPPS